MNKLSIKIKIHDRSYPMKVNAEEESYVRQAGKVINEQIQNYRETFNIDDPQDLLAMVAFDCLVRKLQKENQLSQFKEDIHQQVRGLSSLIQEQIKLDNSVQIKKAKETV